MKLRTQLVLMAVGFVVLMLASNAFFLSALNESRDRIASESDIRDRLTVLREVQQSLGAYRFWLVDNAAAQSARPDDGQASWGIEAGLKLEQARQALDSQLRTMAEFAPAQARGIRSELGRLTLMQDGAVEVLSNGRSAAGRRMIETASQALNTIDAELATASDAQRAQAQAAAAAALQTTDRAFWQSVTILIVTTLLVVILTLLMLRSVLPRLRQTVDAIHALTGDDYGIKLPPIGDDEIGRIALGLRQFRDNAKRLATMATTDALTELANRGRFTDAIESSLERLRNGQSSAAVIFMDMNQFKSVNDAMGHSAGDRYLQEVARRLKRAVPGAVCTARLSGDEFALLLHKPGGIDDIRAEALAATRAIETALAASYRLERQPVAMNASLGVALAPYHGWTSEELMSHAETAMYDAKRNRRAAACFYTAGLTEHVREHLAIANALRSAMKRDDLNIYFQPIVRGDDGRLVCAEVLLRWTHPELGVMSPDRFIPIAEQTQTIVELGRWVIDKTCRQLASWLAAGVRVVPVCINISARHFADQSLITHLEKVLRETRVPPDLIELEITEGAVVDDPVRSTEVMRQLKQMGIRLSLDDFGTGYSSLSYLQRYPIDKLKIDQSFVRRTLVDEGSNTIVAATVALGHGLGLTVVGEGVESEAIAERMREHGCDLFQGFHISRGVPAEAFERMTMTHQNPRVLELRRDRGDNKRLPSA